jgi:FkbH-like protein
LFLPADPSGYVRALAEYPLLEGVRLTNDDRHRTERYQARQHARKEEAAASDLPTFWRSLQMQVRIDQVDELRLPRVAQLIAKTNQFNLTTQRHSIQTLRQMSVSPQWVCLYASLQDRFVDHGVVAAALANQQGTVLAIDTLLMSCRVIGRTVENEMLARPCEAALERGVTRLHGTFIPTAKNVVVKDVFERLGFTLRSSDSGTTTWQYDIDQKGPITSEFIQPWNEPVGHP